MQNPSGDFILVGTAESHPSSSESFFHVGKNFLKTHMNVDIAS